MNTQDFLSVKLSAIALGLLAFSLPAAAQLTLIAEQPAQAHLKVFGDVKTVLDGQSTGPLFRQVDPASYLAALGCASVHDDETLQGETLFVAGAAFVKSVDPHTSYTTERAGEKCWASFLAGLSPESKPVARYTIETTEALTIDSLYKQLHRKHGALIGVVGSGRFPELSLSAVQKAPVYGEPILGPKRTEYFHPTAIEHNVDVFFFGLSLRSNNEANELTRRVFYINPADELSTAGQSHTHCALLNAPVNPDETNLKTVPEQTRAVAHVLTQSKVVSGGILVYALDRKP